MQNELKRQIKAIAKRALRRREIEERRGNRFEKKFEKRTGKTAGAPTPRMSSKAEHFQPIYCARNANFLAKTLWHKVLTGTYQVTPAIHFEIDKPNGGKRPIMAFSIPDAALATVVMRRARQRNLQQFSAYSFAYHPTKNLFDAVLALVNYVHQEKFYAIQIDFTKFFDSIPSGYLRNQIYSQNSSRLTKHEKFVFEQFLHHEYASPVDYPKNLFSRRYRGTPQGSSVSLLLANLANNELDIALDSETGKFVRFADDIVALCNTYDQAQNVERRFYEHCERSGLSINWEKSPGTAIISKYPREMRSFTGFDYLGYRFSDSGLAIPNKSVKRLKSRISRLLNVYLIHYLKYGYNLQRSSTTPNQFDWDLLGFIYELRASLYGGLHEADIEAFLNGGKRLPQMRGLMGFYCLVEDSTAFKSLDGWLLSMTRRAMAKRNKILIGQYSSRCPTPSNKDLATGAWLDLGSWLDKKGNQPDPRMPSFVRGWRAARKYYASFGLEEVNAPGYASTNDIGVLFDYG